MPYTVIWLIPDRVIYAHYSGHIAEDELRENLQLMTHMMDNSRFPHVHVISDTGDMVTPIMAQSSLPILQEMSSHERTGWVITIREKAPLIKMSTAFGPSMDSSNVRSFRTLEEAENFLKQADTSLHWGS